MYAFIVHSEWSKLNLWSCMPFLGLVEHSQKVDELCQLSLWLLSVWHKNPIKTGRPRYGPNDNDQWSKVKRVQSMWLCINWGRQFEETFENTQRKKAKQMQPMRLCIKYGRQSEETFGNTQWRKAKQMQPMRICITSGRQFEETFENPQWRKAKQMQPMRLCIN